jgi:hypothetical protein
MKDIRRDILYIFSHRFSTNLNQNHYATPKGMGKRLTRRLLFSFKMDPHFLDILIDEIDQLIYSTI